MTPDGSKPPVWQMVKEAVEALGGKASRRQIHDYIHEKYGEVSDDTVRYEINACTVNFKTDRRENKKPRLCDSPRDFLFSPGRGQLVLYKPEIHGLWKKVVKNGKTAVEQSGLDEFAEDEETVSEEVPAPHFPLEAHLRDFLSKNLETVEPGLHLFEDENGRDGVEYPTDVGPIDILAVDSEKNFVVFELKLSRGPDKACGQLLRYMGWIRKNLAKDKEVRGIILAEDIDEKLKYAACECPKVKLLEYRVSFDIKPVNLDQGS